MRISGNIFCLTLLIFGLIGERAVADNLRLVYEHRRDPVAKQIQTWQSLVDIVPGRSRVEVLMVTILSPEIPPAVVHTVQLTDANASITYDITTGKIRSQSSSTVGQRTPAGQYYGDILDQRFKGWRIVSRRIDLLIPCRELQDPASATRACIGEIDGTPVVVFFRGQLGKYFRETELSEIRRDVPFVKEHFEATMDDFPTPVFVDDH